MTPLMAACRAQMCWAKLRGSRTLRCVRPAGHPGRHSRLHMVIATFKITKELMDQVTPRRAL